MGDFFINLDLNQPPVADPPPSSPPATNPPGFGLFLTNHETPCRSIEDRIRFAIRVSARLPSTRVMTSAIEPIVGERLRNYKRDVTHLAKALEMDVDGGKVDDEDDEEDKGVVFDCNVCLCMAKDPVLTCCGHLFCWGCFYQVPYVDSVSKECPVCNGEVTDSSVVPVYGNGNGNGNVSQSSGVRVPPRPKARRVESVREESVFHNTVVDAVRRLRDGLGMVDDSSSSVVHASVDIRSEGRRYGGDVEVDASVTGTRRRRRRRLR